MIVTIYRVQAYQVPIVNPRWPPKTQDGRYEIEFLKISTSDRGDFLRIIEIANATHITHVWIQHVLLSTC